MTDNKTTPQYGRGHHESGLGGPGFDDDAKRNLIEKTLRSAEHKAGTHDEMVAHQTCRHMLYHVNAALLERALTAALPIIERAQGAQIKAAFTAGFWAWYGPANMAENPRAVEWLREAWAEFEAALADEVAGR